MFTGIVQQIGIVQSLDKGAQAARLQLQALGSWQPQAGESIAVNGCCLTVLDAKSWAFDLSPETLALTSLGALKAGVPVNIERALRAGEALGGHLMAGHVDGLAQLQAVQQQDAGQEWALKVPPTLARYVANKGSVALDGVSLTPFGVTADSFRVALIPHTLTATTLGQRKAGESLNLEVDLLARYVERMLGERAS